MPGKINASLSEKLKDVEWGEYSLSKLFTKIKVNSLKYKTSELPSKVTKECFLPALTAGIQNQGLNNYVSPKNATVLKDVITISANGANTGATFYQSKEFTVLQDAYAVKWIYNDRILSDRQYLFLVGAITKTIRGNYEWTNKAGWEKIKNKKIQLPTKNHEIDFDFMEDSVKELEEERIEKISDYLKVSGLEDYVLTNEEQEAIKNYKDLIFDNYDITKIFDIKNTKNILSSDVVENSGTTPYLCASIENNAISSYITYDKNLKDKGNCIFIGGKTFVVTYQKSDFYSNDSHNLALYLKNYNKTRFNQLYFVTCIKKSLSYKYSWGNSVSNTKIKSDSIALPTKDGKIDIEAMDTFISAIHKLVIKDVVLYVNRKTNTTKKVSNND